MDLITLEPAGLFCAPGGFYVDPWRPVERAVITHAHGDHASFGHQHYLVSQAGEHVTRRRVGDAPIQTLAYGEAITINGVKVSLHPAGRARLRAGAARIRRRS